MPHVDRIEITKESNKMQSLFNLLNFLILLENTSQFRYFATSEPVPQTPKKQLNCYVCSTMNYENTTDNRCRFLKPKSNDSPMTMFRSHEDGFSQYQGQESTETSSTSTTVDRRLSRDIGDGPITPQGFSHVLSNRTVYPNDYVGTRECSGNEHYCVVRSVMRYEFINDEIQPKFWTLERNCSKSCYNDCIQIGDRHRLRICNSCCSKTNCNLGSGSKSYSIVGRSIEKYFVVLLMVHMISGVFWFSNSINFGPKQMSPHLVMMRPCVRIALRG